MPETSERWTVDEIIQSFQRARAACELLPALPPNIKPAHIRMLDALHRVRNSDGEASVSDINAAFGGRLPNTTAYLTEMTQLGLVTKSHSAKDRRVVLIHPTALGEQYISHYVITLNTELSSGLKHVDEHDISVMVSTINQVCSVMEAVYKV